MGWNIFCRRINSFHSPVFLWYQFFISCKSIVWIYYKYFMKSHCTIIRTLNTSDMISSHYKVFRMASIFIPWLIQYTYFKFICLHGMYIFDNSFQQFKISCQNVMLSFWILKLAVFRMSFSTINHCAINNSPTHCACTIALEKSAWKNSCKYLFTGL